MVKDKAEIIVIIDHFQFQYFYELRLYLKKHRPDLFYLLSDFDFVQKIKTFLFNHRVSPSFPH